MIDSFVHPIEPSAAEAIAAIRDEFEFLDDDDMKYTQLMHVAKTLPPFPEELQDEAHKVPGCIAQVWMNAVMQDGRLYLSGTSDSVFVAGLVAMLLRVYSGRSTQEILSTDPAFLTELGMATLSTNRGNGIAAMARRIRDVAQACAAPT